MPRIILALLLLALVLVSGCVQSETKPEITVLASDKAINFTGKTITFLGNAGEPTTLCDVPLLWQDAEVDGELVRLATVLELTEGAIVKVTSQDNDFCPELAALLGIIEHGEVIDRDLTLLASLDLPELEDSGSDCVKTQVMLALKHYYPERNYSRARIDQLVGGTQKWTWFSQAFKALREEGLDAEYYSMSPYEQIAPETVKDLYGEDIGQTFLDVTNWGPLNESIKYLEGNPHYHYEQLNWSQVEQEFQSGRLIMLIIDLPVLSGSEPDTYTGHAVTITAINRTHVSLRGSGRGPDWVKPKQNVIDAWSAPGTDNDAIVIKGPV